MIEIKHLLFQYKKKQPLFTDFSVELNSGSIVGLLGKNGAGKSTLLNILAGLIPEGGGSIIINGYHPFERNPFFLADTCLVPEEFGFPSVTIDTYVKATQPFYPSFDTEKLNRILKEFELDQTKKLNQLSHGQRKKFLIAFTLATNCKLLLLDEPTNGLDIPSKSQFRKILVSSVTDDQLVIISTHQVKDIDAIIDRVVIVDNGILLFDNDMQFINQHWYFDTVSSLNGLTDILHHEICPQGYKIVRPVIQGVESPIDLELLFNAVVSQAIN